MHPDITETSVNGIPTLLAPRLGGQVAAGLLFRVGSADETLATHGITHLVEHLALHDHGVGDLHYNGATADTYTHFHVEGSREHVADYLNGVCSALGNLPLHRLETEKEILRTEASGRGTGPAPQLPLWRYGAQGFGLRSYDELGLARIDAAMVQQWAGTHFTQGNAVLWITDDTVPPGLDLLLPRGRRNPSPPVTSALPTTPAWYYADGQALVLESIVTRSCAATVFAQVLSKALWADLRQESGYSYTAAADYRPRDATTATITAMADFLPERKEAVIGAFVDVLARLRFGEIGSRELSSAQAHTGRLLEDPHFATRALPSYAVDVLTGHPTLTPKELAAEIEAVTVADLREVAEAVHASALVQVPALGLDWAGFTQAPEVSTTTVSGREFTSADAHAGTAVVGTDGVGVRTPAGQVTVHFRDTAAMLAFPDGARHLIGRDGFAVRLEPTLYPIDETAFRTIDHHVMAQLVVPMPARAPERIPRPDAQSRVRPNGKVAPTRPRSPLGTVGFWIMAAVTIVIGLAAVGALVEKLEGGTEFTWVNVATFWGSFALGCAYFVTDARRQRKRVTGG